MELGADGVGGQIEPAAISGEVVDDLLTGEIGDGVGAFMDAVAVDTDGVDSAIADKEREVFADQARQSGKPEQIVEKMVEGRMRKFYEEVVLLKQSFVMDPDNTIEQVLANASKELGTPVEIVGFQRVALGEGVEKKEEDFAAEVAAATGQA